MAPFSTLDCEEFPFKAMPWKIASFDLDGTLVRGTSSGAHLAGKIGHLALIRDLEAQYYAGTISNAEFAALDAAYFNGLTMADIAAHLEDIPVIGEIEKTVRLLAELGIPSILSTCAWDVVAQVIAQRYGFVAWSGPSMTQDAHGRFTGRVAKDFEDADKIHFVDAFCRASGSALSQVFHVGDSRSDLLLFEKVGFAVALNATPAARARAHVAMDGESLFDVLPLIPGLLSAGGESWHSFTISREIRS